MRGVTNLLAITHSAPSEDRAVVMAFPSPVPPPVIKATLFLKVPGRSITPSEGGKNLAWGLLWYKVFVPFPNNC